MQPKKVFIMSLPRSGSTLLGQQLGIHTNIVHMGETMYWELLSPTKKRCSCGQLPCKTLLELSDEIQSEQLALPLLRVWQATELHYWPGKKWILGKSIFANDPSTLDQTPSINDWLGKCPAALRRIISVYSRHTSGNVFVDNTKLFSIAELLVDDPSWRILILLRDPRGVLASYQTASERKGDMRDVSGTIQFCGDFIKSAIDLGGRSNIKIVKYEEFCATPEVVLKDMCSFLGESYQERMSRPFSRNDHTASHVLMGNRLLDQGESSPFKVDTTWQSVLGQRELNLLSDNSELVVFYKKYGYALQ